MNGQQLWEAMKSSDLAKGFDGFYLEEKFPKGRMNCNRFMLVNDARHWVVICCDERGVCLYYDPLGDLPSKKTKQFLDSQSRWAQIPVKSHQKKGNSLCGEYCLLYAFFRLISRIREKEIDLILSSDVAIIGYLCSGLFQMSHSLKK